jgi:hypothetical protein
MLRVTSIVLSWMAGLFVAAGASAQQISFNDAVIQGAYKCNLTAYGLPSKDSDPFPVTALGDITGVADGRGKWTSGEWHHSIDAPGIHANCHLTMISGTYSVRPNGTGTDITKWRLVKGDSAPNCLLYFPDAAETPTTESELIVRDPSGKMFYSTSINPYAVLVTACQK